MLKIDLSSSIAANARNTLRKKYPLPPSTKPINTFKLPESSNNQTLSPTSQQVYLSNVNVKDSFGRTQKSLPLDSIRNNLNKAGYSLSSPTQEEEKTDAASGKIEDQDDFLKIVESVDPHSFPPVLDSFSRTSAAVFVENNNLVTPSAKIASFYTPSASSFVINTEERKLVYSGSMIYFSIQ